MVKGWSLDGRPGISKRMKVNWPARYGRTLPDSGASLILVIRGAILSMATIPKRFRGLKSLIILALNNLTAIEGNTLPAWLSACA